MDNCPKCKTSFIGDPIPQEYLDEGCYGDSTHYRREIGIDGEYLGIYDGVVAWRCPDCGHEFPVSQHPVALELFNKYLGVRDENQTMEENTNG